MIFFHVPDEWDTEIGTKKGEIETERKMCQKIHKGRERDVSNRSVQNQSHMGKERSIQRNLKCRTDGDK